MGSHPTSTRRPGKPGSRNLTRLPSNPRAPKPDSEVSGKRGELHTHPDGTPCRLVGKGRVDKHLVCPLSGDIVARDYNTARNLRDWPDTPVDAQLGRGPRTSAVPETVPETAAQTIDPSNGLRSSHKTTPTRAAASSEGKTGAAKPAATEPRKRSA
jgi:hypothetical protein